MTRIKEYLQNFVFQEGLKYLEKDPVENIPRLLNWLETLPTKKDYKAAIELFKKYSAVPDNNWSIYVNKLLTELNPHFRKTFFNNFLLKATLLGRPLQQKLTQQYDCNIPWTILIDPTSACNLNCTGCWASEYEKSDSLSFNCLDNIIQQGRELGIYMYLFSGGEPTVRKADLIKLAEKHHDCAFLAFTNGTLFDQQFVQDLIRVGNFTFAFSIEGDEAATDFRRGQGTYRKVISAMDLLKEAGIGFGYSCCYHSRNIDSVASAEFVDLMIAKGSRFAWYFTYMPLGKHAVMDLVCTPQQREYMYHRIREIRTTKPLFALDFWNDGEYVEGCIAGGRNYFHINAHGDAEPCAFIHYSTVNITECTLLEALRNPLFQQYRGGQPFNENHLRPCPLLDNPHCLRDMVHAAEAKSTQPLDDESVDELTHKVEHVARAWGKTAERLWNESKQSMAGSNIEVS